MFHGTQQVIYTILHPETRYLSIYCPSHPPTSSPCKEGSSSSIQSRHTQLYVTRDQFRQRRRHWRHWGPKCLTCPLLRHRCPFPSEPWSSVSVPVWTLDPGVRSRPNPKPRSPTRPNPRPHAESVPQTWGPAPVRRLERVTLLPSDRSGIEICIRCCEIVGSQRSVSASSRVQRHRRRVQRIVLLCKLQ